MLGVCNFLNKYQIKSNDFNLNRIQLDKPIKIGSYAVKLNPFEKRELLNANQEDFFFKYRIDQIKIGDSLKVNAEQKFENAEEVFKRNGELDAFLKYVLLNKNTFFNEVLSDEKSLNEQFSELKLNSKCKFKYDFVALRSLLSVLLRCQYLPDESFTIEAEKFDDVIYLQMYKKYDNYYIQKVNKHAYASHKFETLATKRFDQDKLEKDAHNLEKSEINKPLIKDESDKKNASDAKENFEIKFDEELIKNIKYELCFVFSNKIGINNNQYTLVYPASMCCFENKFDLNKNPIDSDLINGVELKINKEIIGNSSATKIFESKKILKHWCQSKLSNVKKITCAFWKGNFKISRIKEFNLTELERNGHFNSKICCYQFYQILDFIKKSFESNQNTNLLEFEYKEYSRQIICRESDTKVVPEFFKENLSKTN